MSATAFVTVCCSVRLRLQCVRTSLHTVCKRFVEHVDECVAAGFHGNMLKLFRLIFTLSMVVATHSNAHRVRIVRAHLIYREYCHKLSRIVARVRTSQLQHRLSGNYGQLSKLKIALQDRENGRHVASSTKTHILHFYFLLQLEDIDLLERIKFWKHQRDNGPKRLHVRLQARHFVNVWVPEHKNIDISQSRVHPLAKRSGRSRRIKATLVRERL